MAIRSLEALEKACENKNIYDVILEDDCMERGVTREESEKKMADLYAAIQHSAQNYTPTLRSASGMAGGDGAKMRSYVKAGKTICGDELGGGDAEAICHAAALAIKSLLGLVCDPIAGLVEVPCIKRNASGAMVAMCCADTALAGIRSAVPPDEVIMAMKDVGDKMDVSLRETGLGGIAGTPSGVKIADELRLAYGHLNG